MKITLFFIKGMGLKSIRPAIYVWFFNFIFSLFIYYGFYKFFVNATGDSIISENLFNDLYTFTLLLDIYHQSTNSLFLILSMAFLCGIFFSLISIFNAGGVYSILVDNERTSFFNLLASSYENFFCMLKIAFLNLINLFIASIIPILILIIFYNFGFLNPNENNSQIFFLIWILISLVFLAFSTAIYDFSRIFRLKSDSNAFSAFKHALQFIFSNKLKIVLLFLIYAFSTLILFLFYLIFKHLLEGLLFLPLLFISYQIFIGLRYLLKIAFMRTEIKLLDNSQ